MLPSVSPAMEALATGNWHGSWRITRGVAAPWVAANAQGLDTRSWIGRSVEISFDAVVGPPPLSCDLARMTPIVSPAEGLFQGGLPAPAQRAAQQLGIFDLPVAGLRIEGDCGSFDLHRVDADTWLAAIDNVIWTASLSPGTAAEPGTAAASVQAFLEDHFAGDMGFDPSSIDAKARWLSASLLAHARTYFASIQELDEVPPVNGDPFTDSQEYPARFSIDGHTVRAGSAKVHVRFPHGAQSRRLTYLLRVQDGAWQIVDLRFEDGSCLSTLLGAASGECR